MAGFDGMGAGLDMAKDMIKMLDSAKDRKRAEVQQAFEIWNSHKIWLTMLNQF
jgi:hypothetical protein